MRNKLFILSFLIGIFFTTISAQQSPENAQTILDNSIKIAAESNKTVFVVFHASWCVWCRRLDKAINSDELKKIFEDHFVVTHLDVLESPDKKETLENPGGEEIMNKFNGKDAGLPFYVFINSEGRKVADSKVMPQNQNIGYPGAKEEIEAFVGLLKKSNPAITNEELAQVSDYFTKNAPK